MLGIPTDVLIVILVAVLVFGASKIPDIARNLGRARGEFKKGQLEAEKQLQNMSGQDQTQNSNDQIKQLEDKIKQLQDELEKAKQNKSSQ